MSYQIIQFKKMLDPKIQVEFGKMNRPIKTKNENKYFIP